MIRHLRFLIFFFIGLPSALAVPDYHLVGWFNTFIPGGGQALLGDYPLAGTQAVLETGTMIYGYHLSKRSPLTLDGVPEDLPVVGGKNITTTKTNTTCVKTQKIGGKNVCTKFATTTSSSSSVSIDNDEHDFKKPLYADLLLEFGIKYHMVNVFNAYREAYQLNGSPGDEMIDQRPTKDLFLDPFQLDNFKSPWVWGALAIVAGATIYDFNNQVTNGITPIQKMNGYSTGLFAFNYIAWRPIGSGAPEEMFYRGFLQNEMYDIVPSPFFSIAMSSLAFSFSHGANTGSRIGAGISGLYLGWLAHKEHGNLAQGITLHFWSDLFLGIETLLLTKKGGDTRDAPPVGVSVSGLF